MFRRIWLALLIATAATPAGAAPPAPDLTTRADARLAAVWAAEKITPAAPATDAAFLRRVSLDLIGRIPTAAEVRAFLADSAPSAEKRRQLVDRLLASPAHARHFATLWRRAWLPQADAPRFARLADDFEDWVEARLRDRIPYDRLVRELLTRSQGGDGVSPRSFRAAAEFKPENLAANTARAFLGVNLDCAQCHDHPFAKWTRDQFWETAAFFARPEPAADGRPAALPEILVANTKRVVGPRLLVGPAVKWPDAVSADTGPALLAEWVTARDNPFFARNLVNRVWAHLFGAGLVEPLDDLGADAPAGLPAVLDDLAAGFAEGGFDLTALTRALVLTRAYQLSGDPAPGEPTGEPRAFSRAAARGLTGEQLYDSLRTAAGHPADRDDGAARKRFAARFHAERAATAQRSVVQALTLMNGRVTADAVDPATSPLLVAADAPFFDAPARVELAFLAALGRPPSAAEAEPLVAHVRAAADGPARRKALADVFWAVLNTAEFATNH